MNAPYATNQRVEVHAHDFTTPGFPLVWYPATVTEVKLREDAKWDVQVKADKGSWHPQIVGKRGGNSNIRPIAPPKPAGVYQTIIRTKS